MRAIVFAMAACCALGASASDYDLVIYGGTPAGISAAVQAKRMGLKAVMIEPTSRIGGLTTGGLGRTDIGSKEAFGGITREFYAAVADWYRRPENWTRETREEFAARMKAINDKRFLPDADTMWCFEPSVALKILEEWEKRDGLEIHRGKRLDRASGKVKLEEVEGRGRQRKIVSLVTEDGTEYRGKMFIDATYEGDLMAAAGVPYTVGREGNAKYGESKNGIQRGEGSHKLKPGIDPYVVKGDRSSGLLPCVEPDDECPDGAGDDRVQAYCFRMCLTDDPANRIPFRKPEGFDERDYELFFRNCEQGDVHVHRNQGPMPNRKTDTNNDGGFSTDFIGQSAAYPEASYAERERIAERHLRYQQGLMWVLANHPRTPREMREEYSKWGTCRDEFVGERGDGWQFQLYIREARRMLGEYVMTEHERRGDRIAPRPVAVGSYQMDSHHCRRYIGRDGFVHNEGDVQVGSRLPKFVNGVEQPHVGFAPYGIDYGAIVPKRTDCANLLVPVCLSASHICYGSIRMEPVFFALGQAAATGAALALRDGCAVQDVDYPKLRKRLLADGQALPKVVSKVAKESFETEVRGLGRIAVDYTCDKDGASVTTFSCADGKTAAMLAAKRRTDLLSFGDLRAVGGDTLVLDGTGSWTLFLSGKVLTERFTPSAACRDVTPYHQPRTAKHQAPSTNHQAQSTSYPAWLDGFDKYGATMWLGGGGRGFDIPEDFEWLKTLDLGMCVSMTSEDDLFAPGEVDWCQYDWYESLYRKYGLPYRLLTGVGKFPWSWQVDPLPHVLPGDPRYFGLPAFYYADVLTTGAHNAGMPGVPSDKYRFDFRRRLSERLRDSGLMGYQACEELTCGRIMWLAACAKTPGVIRIWKEWKARQGVDNPGPVPVPEDFVPRDPAHDIDLFGTWEFSRDRKGWTPAASNDPMIDMYTRSWHVKGDARFETTYLRRTFAVPKGGVPAARYLHLAVAAYKTVTGAAPDVTVNGVPCRQLPGEFSRCYDLGPALREGANEIELATRGQCVPGYIYLTAKPLVLYPDMSPEQNLRWYDAVNFGSHLRIRYIEDRIRAHRAADPVRPFKMMAVKEGQDEALDLCRRYGAYFHDTGAAGGFWCPFSGARLAKAHGFAWSCEQGGPPATVDRMRAAVSFYLQYGNDAADLVFAIGHYRAVPEVRAWCEENLDLLHAIGKLRLPQPPVAVLRSSRNDRLGFGHDMLAHDVGRGWLQANGREFVYIEIPDLSDAAFLDRYRVVIDCATRVMTAEDCAAIHHYVARGGTFIALPDTGRNLPDRADADPLAKALGVRFDAKADTDVRVGKGRFVRLATYRALKMKDENGAYVPDGDEGAALLKVLDESGVKMVAEVFGRRVWGSHRESKNGVYDVFLVTRMEKEGEGVAPEVSAKAGFFLPGRPWIGFPRRDFKPMETVLWKLPRPDVAHAGVYWIKALAEIWHPVEAVPASAAPVVEKSDDVLVLRDGWTPCTPGFFGAIGYPEDAKVEFRTSVKIPESWSGDEVQLVMHCGFVMRGLSPYGTVRVNGRDVPGYAPFKGFRQGGQFSYDVTDLAKANGGRIDLSVEIDGSKSKEDPKRYGGRPNGAGATFALHRRRKTVARRPLDGPWYAACDFGEKIPVRPGEKAKHVYYQTDFTLTDADRGRRLLLKSDVPIRGLMLNGKVLNVPDHVRELEVTEMLRQDGPNRLYWVPDTIRGIDSGLCDKIGTTPLGHLELCYEGEN